MIEIFEEFISKAVLKVGDFTLLSEHQQARTLSFYTFIRTKQNAITILVDGISETIPPNHIVALTPNQFFKFEAGKNCIVYQFNREFYCIKDHDKEVNCLGILFFGNTIVTKIPLNKAEQQGFDMLHQVVLEEITTRDTIQAEMLRVLIKRYIIKATRILKEIVLPESVTIPKHELIRKFNFLVENNFRKKHKVSEYAALLHKSPKTLSNIFSGFNRSPIAIIQDRIVLEAKRLLNYTDKPVKEIAYNLGFSDASHLSRLFKKNTALSPTAYRKSIQ